MHQHRHRAVARVGDDADPLQQGLAPRLGRDVGRGVSQATVWLQIRVAGLGDDLAVAALVQAVGHHPVVAGQRLEPLHRQFAQVAPGRCRVEGFQHRLHRHDRHVPLDRPPWFDVHAEQPASQMDTQVEPPAADGRLAIHMTRSAADQTGAALQRIAGGLTQQVRQLLAQRGLRRNAQDGTEVRAGMRHQQVARPSGEQGAVRLDCPRDVDLLLGADAQIQLRQGFRVRRFQDIHDCTAPAARSWANQLRIAP